MSLEPLSDLSCETGLPGVTEGLRRAANHSPCLNRITCGALMPVQTEEGDTVSQVSGHSDPYFEWLWEQLDGSP